MFGLGLAIDYSMFIVSRFQSYRKAYPEADVLDIVEKTVNTAGKTVGISALTVFLALSGGLLFEEYFLTSICLAVMLAALTSAVAANSFFVSMLAALNERVFSCPVPARFYEAFNSIFLLFPSFSSSKSKKMSDSEETETERESQSESKHGDSEFVGTLSFKQNPSVPLVAFGSDIEARGTNKSQSNRAGPDDSANEQDSFWWKLAEFVIAHPIAIFLSSSAFLISLSIYFLVVVQYGDTDPTVLPITSPVRTVYDALSDGDFPLYGHSNIYIYIQTKPQYPITSSMFLDSLQQFQDAVYAKSYGDKIANTYSMIDIGNVNFTFSDYVDLYADPYAPQYINYTEALLSPLSLINFQENCTYVQFSLTVGPYTSEAKHIVRSLRSMTKSNDYFYDTTNQESMIRTILVTGEPAINLDLYISLEKGIPAWISIQMIAIFTILMLMTRSLLIPLKAVILSVLSLGATFGLIQLLFQSTYKPTNDALGFVPSGYFSGSYMIFIFSVAFGLSVDYEVFLLSRILESYKQTNDLTLSIKRGMTRTGGIITSAAIMLATTTFAFIGCQVYFIKVIGVGIAMAVVLDSTIIRMLLVPATIVLFGTYNFYIPEPLGKLVDYMGFQETEIVEPASAKVEK
jgi:uncharacterized membrane protein YdfJ with MMPL/SSD domain